MELVGLLAFNVIADAYGWGSFAFRVGPVLLLEYERTDRVSAVTLGSGVLLVALLGGTLNAAGAAVLQRRV